MGGSSLGIRVCTFPERDRRCATSHLGLRGTCFGVEQEVGQGRDENKGAEHVPEEHKGQQDSHVSLELDG